MDLNGETSLEVPPMNRQPSLGGFPIGSTINELAQLPTPTDSKLLIFSFYEECTSTTIDVE